MGGETNLDTLLSSMSPVLLPGEYVFSSVEGDYGDFAELRPLACFVETEGMTLVVPRETATVGQLVFESIYRVITLRVHSSLESVGLTAAVASKLAENGISANVIAAFYHDHILVPSDKAALAMEALNELSQ